MLDVLSQDYIRTARAKGVREVIVIAKHALRNAAMPVVTVCGLDFAYMLGGTIIIENVFARSGLGRMMMLAIHSRDYPLVQGAVLIFAIAVILVNILTDVIYCLIDPRIRFD